MKKIFFILSLCILSLFLTGYKPKHSSVIHFSSVPFTQNSGYVLANTFKKGEKIYYTIYNKKGFKTKLLKLQVFKKSDNNSEFWGYEYLYNKTLELSNKNTYTDYIVIHSTGHYVFQVFDYTDFQTPVTLGIVQIVE